MSVPMRDVANLEANETTLWVVSAVIVSFVGIFARYLDDVEEKKYGKLLLRFSNLFCATFCCVVSVVYYSIVVVQAGGGTIEGFVKVLKGEIKMNRFEEYQAAVVHATMLAYMAQDLVGRLIWKNFRPTFVVHHVACIVGLANALFFGQSGMFGAAVGLSEFTTPLVACIEIARADGMKKPMYIGGALLFFLFPLRVALFTYFNYLWLFVHDESPAFGTDKSNFVVGVTSMISIIFLTLLNWMWWSDLLKMCFNAFVAKESKLPEASYASRSKLEKKTE
mmetsp:Transcript_22056/g.43375  ORF Transcript_22056/g.43375 Transcript_22056/m.43375 type:complete len:279 (+) Transcript_22056:187-1023(+)|eukprot:CAMPEP_0171492526 /NCGR_PEP_ID=MMETSP0958-20121227/4459_1 /TAXON_ID=87120 /ORGANISM="Aurantiochytrium limacinum, Strain ATCCMYA-1381" /LENGTH=278 /DNA_ID=CAMNT_0012026055 /DNA_START=141 /DNA_END=977 /DNA_ORIENTATION=-